MSQEQIKIEFPPFGDSDSNLNISNNIQVDSIINQKLSPDGDQLYNESSKKLFDQVQEQDIELSQAQNNDIKKQNKPEHQKDACKEKQQSRKGTISVPQKIFFIGIALTILTAIIVGLTVALTQKTTGAADTNIQFIVDNIKNSAPVNLISKDKRSEKRAVESAFDVGIVVQPDFISKIKSVSVDQDQPLALEQNQINIQKCMPYPPSFWDSSNQRLLPYISMDKPIYKQNDVMFIELYLIDPITKQPYIETPDTYYQVSQTTEDPIDPPIAIEQDPIPSIDSSNESEPIQLNETQFNDMIQQTPIFQQQQVLQAFPFMQQQLIAPMQAVPLIQAPDNGLNANIQPEEEQAADELVVQPDYDRYKSSIYASMLILDSFNKQIYDSSQVSYSQSQNGTLMFTYKIPNDLSGGEYQIKITSSDFPVVWRKFRINQNSQPDLFVTADFDRNNYSPGDNVKAKVKVRRPDGQQLQDGTAIAFQVMLDPTQVAKPVPSIQTILDSFGEAQINFTIPATFSQKVLTLTIKTYIGTQRFMPSVNTFTVPVLDRDSFQVKFFSEVTTQALVANVSNKVYFQVLSKQDTSRGEDQILEPIEFTVAQLIKVAPNTSVETTEVSNIKHIHLGRSYFQFTPDGVSTYYLQVFRSFNDEIFVMKNFWLSAKVNSSLSASATIDNSYDGKVLLRISTNSLFNKAQISRNLTVQIKNKDEIIYEGLIALNNASGAQQKDFMISYRDSIYPTAPAGGVMIMKITENKTGYPLVNGGKQVILDAVNLERLIFVKPSKKLEFNISTDSDIYQPGKKVLLNVTFDATQVDKDEQVFASITVTDLSSFLKVEKAKLPPSLPAMVFLEKEIQDPINPNQTDEFYHSSEYLDAQFQSLQAGEINQLQDLQNQTYRNLDLLLATQEWRRGKLDDFESLQSEALTLDEDTKQRAQLEYLLGKKAQSPWRPYIMYKDNFNMQMEAPAMMAAPMMQMDFAMAVPMAAMARVEDAMPMMAAAEVQPRAQMAENLVLGAQVMPMAKMALQDAVPILRAMVMPLPIPKLDPLPKPTKPIKIDSQQRDFMLNIEDNTRDYSHNVSASSQTGQRIDFTQTLLARSAQFLVPVSNGSSTLQLNSDFFLNDQVSSFQIRVNLFTSKGKFAVGKKTLVSNRNIYSQFTLPTSFVLGDQLIIPINVQNNFDQDKNISVQINQIINQNVTLNVMTAFVVVGAKQQDQVFFNLDTLDQDFKSIIDNQFQKLDKIPLQMSVQLQLAESNYTDLLTQSSFIVQNGFKQQQSQSDRLVLKKPTINATKTPSNKSQKTAPPQTYRLTGKQFQVILPKSLASTPRFTVKAYAQPLNNILDALQSLIQNPYGCFEQTSSTTYPMVMALQLLQEMYYSVTDYEQTVRIQKMQDEIIEKLKDGYKKLIGFETPSKGYEWFGNSPGHEALTSYGLAQFQDMAKVVDFVDKDAIQRNQNWILDERRAPKQTGKFLLSSQALDTFGKADQNITDAYIVWVLTQDGQFSFDYFKKEFKNLASIANSTKDPYFLSLYAGALFNVGQNSDALKIAKKIVQLQNSKTGAVEGALSSITSSSGESLIIETTSLAVIDWLNLDPATFASNIELGIGYLLTKVKDGGRFGSTQSTVLSLKALIAYQKSNGGLKGKGNLVLYLNDTKVESVAFDQELADPLSKFDFTDSLNEYFQGNTKASVGSNFTLKLAVENYTFNDQSQDFKLNYLMQVDYKDQMPPSGVGAAISFNISGSSQQDVALLSVGDIGQANITIVNNQNKSYGMAVAIISVPSCLDVDMKQLEILKQRGAINQYEISADKTSITLYWTYLKAKATKNVVIDRVKMFDGPACLNRASQAYLYYQDEFRVWIK